MSRLKLIPLMFLLVADLAFAIGIYPTSQDAGSIYTNTSFSYQYTLTNDYVYNYTVGFTLTSSCSNLSSNVTFTPSSVDMTSKNTSITFNVTVNTSGMPSSNYTLVFKPEVTASSNVTLNPNGIQTGGSLVTVSAGVLSFEALEAATTTTTLAPGPGGGGGGGGAPSVSNFTILNKSVKVPLKQGEVKTVYVIVKNTGKTALKINVDMGSLEEIVFPEEETFKLKQGETKKLLLDVVARQDLEPDLYAGKLTLKANKIKRSIPFYVEVETVKALFDVKVKIPDEYKKIIPGEDLFFITTIYNLKRIGTVDVNVEYIVKDLENNVVYNGSEVKAVETEVSFVKSIKMPATISPGEYMLYVKVTYDDSVAIASDTFEVTEFYFPTVHPTVLLSIIVAIVLLLAYMRKKRRKHRQNALKKRRKSKKPIKRRRRANTGHKIAKRRRRH